MEGLKRLNGAALIVKALSLSVNTAEFVFYRHTVCINIHITSKQTERMLGNNQTSDHKTPNVRRRTRAAASIKTNHRLFDVKKRKAPLRLLTKIHCFSASLEQEYFFTRDF